MTHPDSRPSPPNPHGTAVITGALGHLGPSLARTLAAHGYTVVLHTHQAAADLPDGMPPNTPLLVENLEKAGGVERLFQKIDLVASGLELLINCVGVLRPNPLEKETEETILGTLHLNAAVPALCMARARERGATHIINLLDAGWNRSWKDHGAYIASKAALAAFTRVAAAEFAPDCRVNALAPGLFFSPPEMEQRYERVVERIPMRRKGALVDLQKALEMLLESPQYMTGQILQVDGGLSLT